MTAPVQSPDGIGDEGSNAKEQEKLLFFNYHEYMISEYQPVGNPGPDGEQERHQLVVTHFPSPYGDDDKDVRVVRIPRDYQHAIDDNIPIFSNVMPGYETAAILEPITGTANGPGKGASAADERKFVIRGCKDGQYFGFSSVSPLCNYLSVVEFRSIVDKINESLERVYSPFRWSNAIWVWADQLLLTIPSLLKLNKVFPGLDKAQFAHLENYIAELNDVNTGLCGSRGIHLISPRASGFLSLDFQIPTPKPLH